MGMPYYSFSISWQRILPFTLPGTPINQEGLQHYDDLINFVLEKGMEPIVTLIHGQLMLTHNLGTYGLQYVNRTTKERRYRKSFFDMMDYYNTRTARVKSD